MYSKKNVHKCAPPKKLEFDLVNSDYIVVLILSCLLRVGRGRRMVWDFLMVVGWLDWALCFGFCPWQSCSMPNRLLQLQKPSELGRQMIHEHTRYYIYMYLYIYTILLYMFDIHIYICVYMYIYIFADEEYVQTDTFCIHTYIYKISIYIYIYILICMIYTYVYLGI